MAGFRKAKAEQAAIKMGIYGPPGSGKTFTTLLLAEGLAKASGKRIAYVDTERGTDFYCKAAPRPVHPEPFDFDALYTKSITEIMSSVRSLSPDEYGVIVIDSITHVWESCIAAYNGGKTSAGTIPMHAWGRIKKPYKDLMSFLLSSPMHVVMCGRQGVEYATNEDTDELKAVGYKMKAEGETPYEPHILIRMEAIKPKRSNELATIVAYAEKDRTGVLAGRSIIAPDYDSLCAPLLQLLGGTQAHIATTDENAAKDSEALADQARQRAETSADMLKKFSARIDLSDDVSALKVIGKEITPAVKSQMTPEDVASLRDKYHEREQQLTRTASVASKE